MFAAILDNEPIVNNIIEFLRAPQPVWKRRLTTYLAAIAQENHAEDIANHYRVEQADLNLITEAIETLRSQLQAAESLLDMSGFCIFRPFGPEDAIIVHLKLLTLRRLLMPPNARYDQHRAAALVDDRIAISSTLFAHFDTLMPI